MKILNNLNYEQIINILGYQELPLEYKIIYRGFISYLAKQKDEFLDENDLIEINSIINLDSKLLNDLIEKAKIFNTNKDLVIASYFFKYALYVAIHPSANSIYENPNCQLFDNLYFKAFMFLCIVKESYEENIRRNIPKKYWERRYLDVKRFVEKLVSKKEDMPFRFSTFTPYAQMYNIGHFMYMPYIYLNDNIAFKNKHNDTIILAGAGQIIRSDGQLDGVNKISEPLFKTTYLENEESYIGNPINPEGYFENKTVTLNKKEWKKHLSYGDVLLEFHVHDNYNPETFYQDNLEACAFFKKYFPEMKIKALYGYSWLFSPQMKFLVNSETSNIGKIKNIGYVIPNRSGESLAFRFLFNKEHVEVEDIPETSSLLKNLKAYMQKGYHINCGSYYFFTDDFNDYFNNKYISFYKNFLN